jgi:hypothetical protein
VLDLLELRLLGSTNIQEDWTPEAVIGAIEKAAWAMKKNKLSFAGKWMELENIILSEVSLAQKIKNRIFSLVCGH